VHGEEEDLEENPQQKETAQMEGSRKCGGSNTSTMYSATRENWLKSIKTALQFGYKGGSRNSKGGKGSPSTRVRAEGNSLGVRRKLSNASLAKKSLKAPGEIRGAIRTVATGIELNPRLRWERGRRWLRGKISTGTAKRVDAKIEAIFGNGSPSNMPLGGGGGGGYKNTRHKGFCRGKVKLSYVWGWYLLLGRGGRRAVNDDELRLHGGNFKGRRQSGKGKKKFKAGKKVPASRQDDGDK